MDLSFIRQRLAQPLPGLDAQMTMAPPIRRRDVAVPEDARRSAVLVLIYPFDNQWIVPFMRRTDDARIHAGQVCFPGGRREPGDPDFQFTALREADEEMGIPHQEVEVLGALTEVYIPPSNSLVFPFLGYLPARPVFVPAPREVADIIEVPLSQLLDPAIRGTHRVDVFGGNMIEAPGYVVHEKHLIWGATAMMIAELAALLARE
ncbi:MAG: CoA pyrophosphatase [Bacteroidetes bacterium]|nr:MAG: CoA pyrophosphatase [Bacteroidota bacterium]